MPLLLFLDFECFKAVDEDVAQGFCQNLGRNVKILKYPQIVCVHDTAGDKARVYRCGLPRRPSAQQASLSGKNILREPCLQVNAEIIDVYELKSLFAGSRLAIIISAAISMMGYGSFSSSLAV